MIGNIFNILRLTVVNLLLYQWFRNPISGSVKGLATKFQIPSNDIVSLVSDGLG